jgi:NADPH:quinone reductase-like Zn-dependent oxidoreductase
MRAVVMHVTGDADALHLEEAERPEPEDGEVLVRVRAAAVNPVDWKYRRGLVARPLPAVLGEDISGTVEASRAGGFAPGDQVFGIASSGGYAEFALASASALAIKPDQLSYEQAAALPVSAMTAWQALFDRGQLEQGQTVLIAGAAGGVGHLAVQLAKHAGTRVIGTGSARSRGFVLGVGADGFVDYTHQNVADAVGRVDVALDTVGADTTKWLIPAVREGGILVTVAYPPEAPPRSTGLCVEPLIMGPSSEQLTRIGDLVASGEMRVELAEVLPLTDVQRAHELSESRHARGKIVLTVETPGSATKHSD